MMSDVIEMKIMITKVLLPRIRQLEQEVSSLRKHTWPYVQARKEHHELDDMEAKMNFFKHLCKVECSKLNKLHKSRNYLIGHYI